jgi:hypothetical protein
MLVVGGWAYAELAPAAAPPGYYPIGELVAGLAAVAAGVLVSFVGAVYVVRRDRPGARFGVLAAFGLAGLTAGYFVPAFTGRLEASYGGTGDQEEVWVRVFDTPVHHEVGRPGEAFKRARAYRDWVVLPGCAAAGCIVGLAAGWVAARAARRPDPLAHRTAAAVTR